jgi:DNA repair protein RecO (recombination protein O)
MIEETQGIILRTIRYSESSLIVHWLTEDHGRISTMVRGALKPKSSFRGKLDLFYVCQLSFQRSTRSTLHHLREINLKETFERLRHDVEKINQASYVAQLTSKRTLQLRDCLTY